MGALPDDVLIIENFLDTPSLNRLVYYVEGEIGIVNKVDLSKSDGALVRKRVDAFYSERIHLLGIDALAKEICWKIFGEVIPGYYGADIEWYEYPHVIRYRIGGTYKPHADADHWHPEKQQWVRGVDRDYSAILYLNDEFEGGGLFFPEYDVRIIPKPGQLVCFPSDGKFVHTAEPVIKGNRYAFVTWAAAHGTVRVQDDINIERVHL